MHHHICSHLGIPFNWQHATIVLWMYFPIFFADHFILVYTFISLLSMTPALSIMPQGATQEIILVCIGTCHFVKRWSPSWTFCGTGPWLRPYWSCWDYKHIFRRSCTRFRIKNGATGIFAQSSCWAVTCTRRSISLALTGASSEHYWCNIFSPPL